MMKTMLSLNNSSESSSGSTSTLDSSPVLGFEQRKLAFENSLNCSNYSDRNTINAHKEFISPVATKPLIVPNKPHSNFLTKKPPFSSTVKPVIPLLKPKLDASPASNGLCNVSKPAIDAHFTTNRSSGSSCSSSPRSPKKNVVIELDKERNFESTSDHDSDDELDSAELLRSRIPKYTKHDKNSSSQNSEKCRPSRVKNRCRNSPTRKELVDEIIPVFCVQDYERGKIIEPRQGHSRSRSVGSALKVDKNVQNREVTSSDDVSLVKKRWKMSSHELDRNYVDRYNHTCFKDKQMIVAAVINRKGDNNADTCNGSRQKMEDSKISSKVFRKFSFTSKTDKDLQNKSAKRDMCKENDKKSSPNNSLLQNTAKSKINKMIPSLNPLLTLRRNSPPSCGIISKEYKNYENIPVLYKFNNGDKLLNAELMRELQETNLKNINDLSSSENITSEYLGDIGRPQEATLSIFKPKPEILPKTFLKSQKKAPIKPSQIYSIRHPESKESVHGLETLNNQLNSPNKSASPVEFDFSLENKLILSNEGYSSAENPIAAVQFNAETAVVNGACAPSPPVRPPRRRHAVSGTKKQKAPLPPTSVIQNISSIKSSGPTEIAKESDDLQQNDSASNDEFVENFLDNRASFSSSDGKGTPPPASLPQGPPPQKPPRTFAYEIYSNNKIRRLSKSSSCETADTIIHSQNVDASVDESYSKNAPIYAVPVKKHAITNKIPKVEFKNNGYSECNSKTSETSKPAIAPKPAHIQSLSTKRLSLGESIDNRSDEDEENLQKRAHLRYSCRRPRRDPPDTPPPQPPSGPKPTSGAESSAFAEVDGPISLQGWSSYELLKKEGHLNKHMSMSDETLSSSSVRTQVHKF